jgi:hypothetical protein
MDTATRARDNAHAIVAILDLHVKSLHAISAVLKILIGVHPVKVFVIVVNMQVGQYVEMQKKSLGNSFVAVLPVITMDTTNSNPHRLSVPGADASTNGVVTNVSDVLSNAVPMASITPTVQAARVILDTAAVNVDAEGHTAPCTIPLSQLQILTLRMLWHRTSPSSLVQPARKCLSRTSEATLGCVL